MFIPLDGKIGKLIDPIIIFSAPVVDFLNGAVVIVNKAMLTKLVPENELGKYNPGSNLIKDATLILSALIGWKFRAANQNA